MQSHKRPLVKRPVHGSGSGAKACTQCGTTRTPQWREGPLGAKTLCNACGVKLVRKKRSMLEAERRAAGLAPPPKGTPLRYLLLAPAAMAELAGSPATSGVHSEPEAAAWQQHHHTSAAVTSPSGRSEDGGAPMSQRRPQRRAAARAAEITAEFASTGAHGGSVRSCGVSRSSLAGVDCEAILYKSIADGRPSLSSAASEDAASGRPLY